MRILHISDLHFGAHGHVLKESLGALVATLQPHVILATGDLVDQPKAHFLQEARQYLNSLALESAGGGKQGAAQLIVVPGNHDRRYFGTLRFKHNKFEQYFGDLSSSQYLEKDNVWIHGFDSSGGFRAGANGKILSADIHKFNLEYERLSAKFGDRFRASYKIAALHHHPLPINLDSRISRWLTLANAAEFLNAVLKRNINLVVHGHEHIRARVGFSRHELSKTCRRVQCLRGDYRAVDPYFECRKCPQKDI